MKNIKDMLKISEKKRDILLVILVCVILISLGILLFSIISGNKKISDVEKLKIKEVSNDTMLYMEYVENTKSKEIDKYIIYALKYSNKELSVKEISKLIDSKFDKKITKNEILNLGITPYMHEENVIYDLENNIYKIENENKSYADIAAKEIIKYELVDIKKQRKNVYEVIYDKYVVKNPYEILNYQTEKNKDTKEINKYLKGKENVSIIKKYITKENIKKIGTKDKQVKITYKLKNDKLVVSEIKGVK